MTKTNKKAALSFQKLVVAGKIGEAYDTPVAPDMRHHDTNFAGDAAILFSGSGRQPTGRMVGQVVGLSVISSARREDVNLHS